MDPIGLVLAIPWAACALVLLVALPGLSIGPLVAPGRPGLLERLGRDAAAGLLATSLLATALGLLDLLRPTTTVAGIVALAVLPLHGRRPDAPDAARLLRRARRAGAYLLFALLLVAPALTAGPSGGVGALPAGWSGPAAARAVASAGSLSALGPAWAGERLVASADLPGVAHLAALLQLLPPAAAPALALDRVAVALVAVIVVAALLRRWLGGWAALVGGATFVGVGSVATPLFDDPATVRTLVLAVFGLWLADRAIVERSRRLAAATAVVGAVVLVARIEPFLALVAGIIGLGAAHWLVAPGGGPENAGGLGHRYGRRLGLRLAPPAAARVAIGWVAVALVVAAGAGAAGSQTLGDLLPAGDVLGAASRADPGFVEIGPAPPGWRASGDESWDFWRAAGPASAPIGAPAAQPPPADEIFATAVVAGLLGGGPAGAPVVPLVIGLSLALPLASWPFLDQRRQRLVVAWVGFGLVLAAVAAVAVVRGGAFLDLATGVSRVLPLQWLAGAAAVAFASRVVAVVAAAARARLTRSGTVATWQGPATGTIAVVAVIASLVLGAGLVAAARVTTERPGALSATGAQAYDWIATRLPPDARLLVAGRTTGVAAALGGRTAIVDGPEIGPANEALLARATGLALGARAVLLDPAGESAAAFVAREGITHLLVAGPAASAADLGAVTLFPTDLDALRASPDYALIRSFDDRLWLFAVVARR